MISITHVFLTLFLPLILIMPSSVYSGSVALGCADGAGATAEWSGTPGAQLEVSWHLVDTRSGARIKHTYTAHAEENGIAADIYRGRDGKVITSVSYTSLSEVALDDARCMEDTQ